MWVPRKTKHTVTSTQHQEQYEKNKSKVLCEMYLLERENYIALSPKLYTIKRREKEHTKMKQQQWKKQIEGSKESIFAWLMEQARELGPTKFKIREDGLREVVRLGGSQARDQHPWTLVCYL